MASSSELWEAVGGASKGGLKVRTGKDISSPELPERLATGALVRALELDAASERVFYEKVSGAGPKTGWVSTTLKGKELLVKSSKEISGEAAEAEAGADCADLALQLYCKRFGRADEGDEVNFKQNRQSFEWKAQGCYGQALQEDDLAELERDTSLAGPFARANAHIAVDSRLDLCSHCRLPVGVMAYAAKGGQGKYMHGECLAQIMLKELKEQEQALERKEAKNKRERREEFDIGWKVEHIPRSVEVASRLQSRLARGMCCLVLQEDNTVRIASTVEPAAAVNLEYLATALQVRSRDQREPLFSLDPVDMANPKDSMQVKRFEPAWLAGTSVGEVLFQSDYHLKELSMGEYEQPVVGMKSCHDYSDSDEKDNWKAREWFVVRKAEVQMTEDSVLLPQVKMGVEAREQVVGEQGLEDVRTTRKTHPLVKYAESFTHNFDLIAERKSVVYHLRELAKASVLAKFLIEAEVGLDESWLTAAVQEEDACCLEIPQLWNERTHSQIGVQDGQLLNFLTGTSLHQLYGGVQFGLDKFQLAGGRQPARMMSAGIAARQFVQPARQLSATLGAGLATRQFQRSFGPMGVQPARVSAGVGLDKFALSGAARQPSRLMSAGLAARQFVQPARHLSATLSAGLATRQFQRSFGPMGVQPSRVAGVDLNLNEFNLSAATQVEGKGAATGLEAGADISAAFWSSISDEAASMFSKEDKSLLRTVFHPSLSDRRSEGDCFVPPDTSAGYVQGLRALAREEEAVRRERRQHFSSADFDVESPGELFPSSWRTSVEIARKEEAAQRSNGSLRLRMDYKAQMHLFEPALKKAVPTFDKTAEDGARFRIYRFGSLEVRTVQELSGEEAICAVLSASAGEHNQAILPNEKIVKVTEYVEGSDGNCDCYVVLETEKEKTIVAEEMKNGSVRFVENPKDLEDRNSLAKVLRTSDCAEAGLTAVGVKTFTRDVYSRVSGSRLKSAFRLQ